MYIKSVLVDIKLFYLWRIKPVLERWKVQNCQDDQDRLKKALFWPKKECPIGKTTTDHTQ